MHELGDFTTGKRVLLITSIAIGIGVVAACVAKGLLALIAFFTNVFFYGRFSIAAASPVGNHLGIFVIVIPVIGALIIGMMARYGSDRIRGHGIPEAIEAILINGSRIDAKVAVLKPISAAISIGSGGPFGAEGPIIMTGGACGSLIAQFFHLTAAERKTLLVAGAAAGMSATFAAPVAAVLLAAVATRVPVTLRSAYAWLGIGILTRAVEAWGHGHALTATIAVEGAALFYTGLSASAYMFLGGVAVIVSVLFSSWSTVYAQREISKVDPLLSTTVQFGVSAVLLFLGSSFAERGRVSDWNLTSVLALVFLTIFGSVIAFSLYYWLLSQTQAYQLSTTNLAVPIVAITEGALLLRERVPLLMIGAAVLVLVAIAVVLRAEDESSLALGIDLPEGNTRL